MASIRISEHTARRQSYYTLYMPYQVPFYSSQATPLSLPLVHLISNMNGASFPDIPSPSSFSTIFPVK